MKVKKIYTKEQGIKLLNDLSDEYMKKIKSKFNLAKKTSYGDLDIGFRTFENNYLPGGVIFTLNRQNKLEVLLGSTDKFDSSSIKNILKVAEIVKEIESNFKYIEEYMIKQKEIESSTNW